MTNEEITESSKEAKDKLGYSISNDSLDKQVGEVTWGEIIGELERAYILGATEQHKCDVDKACKFLFNALNGMLGDGIAKNCVEEFRNKMNEL